jgi:hypothetical protein
MLNDEKLYAQFEILDEEEANTEDMGLGIVGCCISSC